MASPPQSCPYLDTITRTLLDFDFEHSCSVSLDTGPHIYCCLVCGKFFRGKGKHTPAYTHSVETGHAVYLHLSKGTFHCLPDDYEFQDPSLADISVALKPVYYEAQIQTLDDQTNLTRDLFGRRYLPGFVGLNNLNKTDFINATLQALAHVRPLRDFFLKCGDGVFEVPLKSYKTISASSKKKRKRSETTDDTTLSKPTIKESVKMHVIDPSKFSPLAKCFGEMIRKMWSDKRFKSTVDPHMLVQAISIASKKRFRIGKQAEAGEFMAWLLHQLHIGVGGKKPGSSIVHHIFQGLVEVTTRQRKQSTNSADDEEDDRLGSEDEEEFMNKKTKDEAASTEIEEVKVDTNFLMLTLDIPEKPLFKDDNGGMVIPQEPLANILKKFDGTSFNDALGAGNVPQKKRFRLKRLPNHLILHLSRFKRNSFYDEKNPTIVAFPVKNMDLSPYVFTENHVELPKEEEVRSMSVKELKSLLKKHGRADLGANIVEKSDLVDVCINFITKSLPDLLSDKYDLVANITHNTPAEVGREGQSNPLEEGTYRCHVQHKGAKQWYEIQDLHVQEIMAQQIGLSESYVLIFERKGSERA